MNLREQLNQIKITPEEYAQQQLAAQQKKYQKDVQQCGEKFIEALQNQLKQDAKCGRVRNNRISGTFRIDGRCNIISPESCEWTIFPKVECESGYRGFGYANRKHVWVYTVTSTNHIFDVLKILQQYAAQENIQLGKLYLIDSDDVRYRKLTATVKQDLREIGKKFYYAIDYSITL